MQIDVDGAKHRLAHEAKEYVLVFLYLYIAIGAIILYKSLILREHGIDYFPFGFAVVKSLILAKFIMAGHMLGVGERFQTRPLIYPTLYKSLVFLILLMVLSTIEETVKGMLNGQTFKAALLDLGGGTLPGILAASVIGFLILLPYIAMRELNDILGQGRLFDLFFKSGRKLTCDRS